jgi:predicted DNA-binding protein (UPF0278 family)
MFKNLTRIDDALSSELQIFGTEEETTPDNQKIIDTNKIKIKGDFNELIKAVNEELSLLKLVNEASSVKLVAGTYLEKSNFIEKYLSKLLTAQRSFNNTEQHLNKLLTAQLSLENPRCSLTPNKTHEISFNAKKFSECLKEMRDATEKTRKIADDLAKSAEQVMIWLTTNIEYTMELKQKISLLLNEKSKQYACATEDCKKIFDTAKANIQLLIKTQQLKNKNFPKDEVSSQRRGTDGSETHSSGGLTNTSARLIDPFPFLS